ncbi:hypothetical protein [Latilactobacillus curvatus]|uniref:hypothetical protein n=1 Tax=Latilactobacillus curvatus TaxID=28038 RepID=UPI000FECB345|nr:hypothetical protein [Latilactobacillus curvatus]QAR35894.1 hypothetical protein EQK21_07370 [Latilactobacillus curvatus]
MARKYLSTSTRTKHTYAFYKERRDNPQWHDDFIQVRSQRRKELIIEVIVSLTIVVVGAGYFSQKDGTKGIGTYKKEAVTKSSVTAKINTEESERNNNSDVSSETNEHSESISDDISSSESSRNTESSSTKESQSSSNLDGWSGVYPSKYLSGALTTDYMNYIVTTKEGIDWLRDNNYVLLNQDDFFIAINRSANGDGKFNEEKTVVNDLGTGLPLINDANGNARYQYFWATDSQKKLLATVKESGHYVFLEGNNEFFDAYR